MSKGSSALSWTMSSNPWVMNGPFHPTPAGATLILWVGRTRRRRPPEAGRAREGVGALCHVCRADAKTADGRDGHWRR